MDLASICGCWVEVKPLITSELKSANFVPILEALYNFAKPFKFFIVDTEDPNVSGRQLVRFFIQFQDKQTKKQMSNIIRTLLNVEIVVAKPPEKQYQFNVDLELAKNYALPIINYQEKIPVNLIDRMVASVAGSDTGIEIIAQADPNSAVGIQKYIYEKIYQNPSISKAFSDQGVNLLGEIVGKDTKKELSKQVGRSGQQHKNDPWIKEVIKNAEIKLHSNLFTCQIIIRSNSSEKAQAVKNALPAAMNRFRAFKNEKKQHRSVTVLRKPSRYSLRNIVLCRLWWVTPLGILLLAGLLGAFNPIQFVSASTLTVDCVPLVLAVFLAVCLFIVFRKRHPIVLSTQELAQIIGLPTAIEKLPIALGKVPVSRMQLGSEQDIIDEQKGEKQALDKEDGKLARKNSLPTSPRLPAFEFEEESSA